MSTVEKVMAGIFGLIAVYLVATQRDGFNKVIGGIGEAVTNTTITLQGGR
jgi:hypothetical protein